MAYNTYTFQRYAWIRGCDRLCRRLGRHTITCQYQDGNCSFSIRGKTVSKQFTHYLGSKDLTRLRRYTHKYLTLLAPPWPIMRAIAKGDMTGCGTCTYCKKLIMSGQDEGVSYYAIASLAQHGFVGRARVACANPEAYAQDAIEWNFTFAYRPHKGFALCRFHTNIPHPHAYHISGNMCLGAHAKNAANTCFQHGFYDTAIRTILEAARTISPGHEADLTLQTVLHVKQCPICRRVVPTSSFSFCACGSLICAKCLIEHKGTNYCFYCAPKSARRSHLRQYRFVGAQTPGTPPIQPGTIVRQWPTGRLAVTNCVRDDGTLYVCTGKESADIWEVSSLSYAIRKDTA